VLFTSRARFCAPCLLPRACARTPQCASPPLLPYTLSSALLVLRCSFHQRMGDSAGHTAKLTKDTEAELATILSDVSKNKAKVIEMLLKSVTTVA
jgi:hypothetical protein